MDREQVIKRIDIVIRELLHSSSKSETDNKNDNYEEAVKLRNGIEEEDKVKLANLLEDLIVLLKDDPDNKTDIKKSWNKIMDGYGHVKPVSEVLELVKPFK